MVLQAVRYQVEVDLGQACTVNNLGANGLVDRPELGSLVKSEAS
jgi:hypothetical protein